MSAGPAAAPGWTRTIRTPAKINLGLRLTGRRADGYHLLESVFVPIDLYDTLEIAWREGPDATALEVEIDPAAGLPAALADVAGGPGNLVHRAALAFRAASGLEGQLQLHLRKAIPAGAGLGGGSSDAAAVLRLLSAEWGARGPDRKHLSEIALGLGADVPFFLAPGPAWVTGIGEQIEPLEDLPSLDLVIANPGISVATAEVYRVTDQRSGPGGDSLTQPRPGSTMRAISRLRSETGNRASALGDLLVNDLEPAAIHLCPAIGDLMDRMRALGSIGVGLSGSGGTVFGVFDSRASAEQASGSLGSPSDSQPTWVRVTRTLANH